jgi:hypothetical protein
MTDYYYHLAVYRTSLIENVPLQFVIDPIKVDIFNEDRQYKVLKWNNIVPVGTGQDQPASAVMPLVLPKDPTNTYAHIALYARLEGHPDLRTEEFVTEIEKAVTLLSLLALPAMFRNRIYMGVLLADSGCIVDDFVRFENRVTISPDTKDAIICIQKTALADQESIDRFNIMSRFYARSLLEKPNEEKFLWLWTVLEVYPMRDSSNIQPLVDCLARILNLSSIDAKNKLGLGRLYGTRCNLIHNGRFDIPPHDLGTFFDQLENTVLTVLRDFVGLPYNGSLDKFL